MQVARLCSLAVIVVLALHARPASADCRCLAVAADVAASIQAHVAKADGLYARGDFAGALAIYARAYATTRDAVLLYAQGMAKWQLGATADARALLQAYLAAGGTLAYRARAEAGLRDLGAGVSATVGTAVGATGRVLGGVTGRLPGGRAVGGVVGGTAGTVGGTVGMVGGTVGGAVGTGLGVASDVPKPKKVAKGAAILLGVVAIAAIGAVGIHSIAAGLDDDISLDAKFDLGLGLTGVAVGGTALYLSSLTVAAGAAGAAAGGLHCANLPAKRPIVAPIALPGGGGLATAMAF